MWIWKKTSPFLWGYTRGKKPDNTEEVEDGDKRRTGKRKQLRLCQKNMCKDLFATPERMTGVWAIPLRWSCGKREGGIEEKYRKSHTPSTKAEGHRTGWIKMPKERLGGSLMLLVFYSCFLVLICRPQWVPEWSWGRGRWTIRVNPVFQTNKRKLHMSSRLTFSQRLSKSKFKKCFIW